MLTAIKGVYDNGKIILDEKAPVEFKTEVIVTFLVEENKPKRVKGKPGGLAGRISISDDFNDPLDDLKDYMY